MGTSPYRGSHRAGWSCDGDLVRVDGDADPPCCACGGERDLERRREMGAAVLVCADCRGRDRARTIAFAVLAVTPFAAYVIMRVMTGSGLLSGLLTFGLLLVPTLARYHRVPSLRAVRVDHGTVWLSGASDRMRARIRQSER